jgi:hypothetical protein
VSTGDPNCFIEFINGANSGCPRTGNDSLTQEGAGEGCTDSEETWWMVVWFVDGITSSKLEEVRGALYGQKYEARVVC